MTLGQSNISEGSAAESESADGHSESNRRSFGIEIIGLISAVSFFFGVYFAYRTFSAGVVTQAEFERLEVGFTLSEAETALGRTGQKVIPTGAASAEDVDVYRWENSTLSYV